MRSSSTKKESMNKVQRKSGVNQGQDDGEKIFIPSFFSLVAGLVNGTDFHRTQYSLSLISYLKLSSSESVLSISDITQPLISLLISSFLAQIHNLQGLD